MPAELEKWLEAHRDAMLDLTTRLVAVATENPPGNRYRECTDLLCAELAGLGFEDTRLEGACVLSFAGKGDRTLYFHGHYDVVPAQSETQFQPYVKGANLFGRGSSDMKSGLAAMIYAAKAIRDCGPDIDGRIGLIFVPDEETAGSRGSRYLAQKGLLGAGGIGMLLPEPTGGVVWNANRGAITLRVTVGGKSAHVGRQHEGVNSFEKAIPLLERLRDLKREVESNGGSILMLGGRAEGGTNFNMVPDWFSFTLDRRINPSEVFEREKVRLLSVIRESALDLTIEVIQEGASCSVDEDGPLARALATNIEKVMGRAPKFEMCPGLLEIRFYAERDIPAFAYGPGLLTVSHGPNEFVPVQNIVNCAAVYAFTAAEVLGIGTRGTPQL